MVNTMKSSAINSMVKQNEQVKDFLMDGLGLIHENAVMDKADRFRLIKITEQLTGIEIKTKCLECAQFNSYNNTCQHWKAEVPAEWIAKGCEAFHEDIPF